MMTLLAKKENLLSENAYFLIIIDFPVFAKIVLFL